MPDVDPQSLQSKAPEQAATKEPLGPSDKPAAAGCGQGEAPKQPKRIFVCCDGTGNEFATKDSLDGNSNVVKLYTALKLDSGHVAYYHPGVGTMGDPTRTGLKKAWSMVEGLAFGYGFSDNVLDAYRYLMQHYATGDVVYIFGFSRGAYTARALAGLLHGYGLLCRGNEGHIPYAWRMYRDQVASQKELNARTIKTDTSFRDTFSHRGFTIYFVGLWDTVSSVGWVSTPVRLLDLAENSTIQIGRHAVSIDERRCFFRDNLWGDAVEVDVPPELVGTPEGHAMLHKQDQQQVWFPGVHSDVGGSYPQLQSGLSNEALRWMMGEVEKADREYDSRYRKRTDMVGLNLPETPSVFGTTRVKMVLGELSEDAVTPGTKSLQPMYEKPKSSMLHNSLTPLWWVLEIFPHLYYDKDDEAVRKRIPLGAYRKIPDGALIHPSVKTRLLDDPCYRPKNITADELPDDPVDPEYDAKGGAYLRFAPKVCRDYTVQQNAVFVFAVGAVELVIAFYLLYGLYRVGRYFVLRMHPVSTWHWIAGAWWSLKLSILEHFHWHAGLIGRLVWDLLVAAVLICLIRLYGFVKARM